jgi:hypothetical protein
MLRSPPAAREATAPGVSGSLEAVVVWLEEPQPPAQSANSASTARTLGTEGAFVGTVKPA